MATVKTFSIRVNRNNNGRVKIDAIEGVTKLRVTQVMALHGKRIKKKRKSKRNQDDTDSDDDIKYENANDDLMDAIYMEILINNLTRGRTYGGENSDEPSGYTVRIPVADMNEDGSMDYDKTPIGWDWEGKSPVKLEMLDVVIRTDKNPQINHYDMIIEVQVEID